MAATIAIVNTIPYANSLPLQTQLARLNSTTEFNALVANNALVPFGLYNVGGILYYSLSNNTSEIVSKSSGSIFATIGLTGNSAGRRQAISTASSVKLNSANAGNVYIKFVDGSAPIAVGNTDTLVALTANGTTLTVPLNKVYMEYKRSDNDANDVPFILSLIQ